MALYPDAVLIPGDPSAPLSFPRAYELNWENGEAVLGRRLGWTDDPKPVPDSLWDLIRAHPSRVQHRPSAF